MQKIIRYGGAVTGVREMFAIFWSVIKSTFTRQWQAGTQAKLLEQELAEYVGVKHAILTTSGSCAGLLALSALELPKGSEIIIPAVTFPTIFNIIVQLGYVPVVADVEVGTYNLDASKLEKLISKKTKAIIAVHALGNPSDMTAINKIAAKHKLLVIEDNCDGLGTSINNRQVGSFSDISFTSLHAAHIVSMGVGGVVFTDNDILAQNVRMYRDWGRQANIDDKWNNGKWPTLPDDQDSRFIYEKIGYNFQILDLQAAMGRVQLKKIRKIKEARRKNYEYLVEHLAQFEELVMPKTHQGSDVCWFALPLSTTGNRKPLMEHLEEWGIETRSMFSGNILRHPAYQNVKSRCKNLTTADWVLEHSFWISCHPALSKRDLKRIVKTFKAYYAPSSIRYSYRTQQ